MKYHNANQALIYTIDRCEKQAYCYHDADVRADVGNKQSVTSATQWYFYV